MGSSHARAYHKLEDFEIVGIVTRSPESRGKLNEELGGGYPEFGDYHGALAATTGVAAPNGAPSVLGK